MASSYLLIQKLNYPEQVYRTFVIWGLNYYVIILPSLTLIATIGEPDENYAYNTYKSASLVSAVGFITVQHQVSVTTSIFAKTVTQWTEAWLGSSLATTGICTSEYHSSPHSSSVTFSLIIIRVESVVNRPPTSRSFRFADSVKKNKKPSANTWSSADTVEPHRLSLSPSSSIRFGEPKYEQDKVNMKTNVIDVRSEIV